MSRSGSAKHHDGRPRRTAGGREADPAPETGHVPDCWDRHPALIEELSALRTARALACDPTTSGGEALHCQEHFAATRHRLVDWVARTGCRPGEHRNDPPNANRIATFTMK